MCNYLGYKVTHVQFIQLNQIEKELGSHAALELLRRWDKDEYQLGEEPITIGLWVGASSLPNLLA